MEGVLGTEQQEMGMMGGGVYLCGYTHTIRIEEIFKDEVGDSRRAQGAETAGAARLWALPQAWVSSIQKPPGGAVAFWGLTSAAPTRSRRFCPV